MEVRVGGISEPTRLKAEAKGHLPVESSLPSQHIGLSNASSKMEDTRAADPLVAAVSPQLPSTSPPLLLCLVLRKRTLELQVKDPTAYEILVDGFRLVVSTQKGHICEVVHRK